MFVASYKIINHVGVILLNNPPVNAPAALMSPMCLATVFQLIAAGPMQYADSICLKTIYDTLCEYSQQLGALKLNKRTG